MAITPCGQNVVYHSVQRLTSCGHSKRGGDGQEPLPLCTSRSISRPNPKQTAIEAPFVQPSSITASSPLVSTKLASAINSSPVTLSRGTNCRQSLRHYWTKSLTGFAQQWRRDVIAGQNLVNQSGAIGQIIVDYSGIFGQNVVNHNRYCWTKTKAKLSPDLALNCPTVANTAEGVAINPSQPSNVPSRSSINLSRTVYQGQNTVLTPSHFRRNGTGNLSL